MDHTEPNQTLSLFVSVSKMVCPVNGEPGFVEDVQIVTAEMVLAIFAWVTALAPSSVVVTAPAEIFAVVTAPEPSSVVVTAPAEIFAVVTALDASSLVPTDPTGMLGTTPSSTHADPLYCQFLPPAEYKSPFVGELGKSIGIRVPFLGGVTFRYPSKVCLIISVFGIHWYRCLVR